MATPLSARPLNARSGMNLPIGSPPWRSLHRTHPALIRGGYHNLNVQPKQLAFVRWMESERVLVAVNADSQSCWLGFQADAAGGTGLPDRSAYRLQRRRRAARTFLHLLETGLRRC